MIVFQVLKSVIDPSMTLWQSRILTIIFTCIMAPLIALFVLLRFEKLYEKINKESMDRRHADEERFRLARNIELLLESTDEGITQIDATGKCVLVNSSASAMLGYERDEMIGKPLHDLIHHTLPDGSPCPREKCGAMNALITGMGQRVSNQVFWRKDGTAFPTDYSSSPIRDLDGTIKGVVITFIDITKRKLAEERLQLTQFAVDHFTDSSIWLDPGGRITYVNDATCRSTGYDRSELLSMHIWDIDPHYSPELLARNWLKWEEQNRQKIENRFETVHRTKSGKIFPVEITGNIFIFKGRKYFVTYDRNITERKQAEEALHEREERLRLALQVAHAGTFEWNIQTGVNKWTPELESMYGLPPGGFPGTEGAWEQMVYSDDRAEAVRRINEAMEKGDFESEWRVVWPDGTLHWLFGRAFVFKDESGKPLKLIGINIDITERKQAEAELETARTQAEMYLDLMSHDIRNYNMIATGFLDLAMDTLELDESERELLSKPLESIQASSRLIDSIVKLQKVKGEKSLEKKHIDICDVLASIKTNYSNIPDRQVTINFEPVPQFFIQADELVYDIFSNLVSNALKHTDPGKPLTINIGLESLRIEGKEYLQVSIEDDGPGIPDDLKARLFSKFKRGSTKTSGRGLGLYLVKTLVDDYGGKVWVEDKVPGDFTKGTRFIILLPAAKRTRDEPAMQAQT